MKVVVTMLNFPALMANHYRLSQTSIAQSDQGWRESNGKKNVSRVTVSRGFMVGELEKYEVILTHYIL